MSLKLVAGLGNPGAEYERTPHNVGFRVVNRVAELASASWRDEPKFKGAVARIVSLDTAAGTIRVRFDEPQFASAPGQVLVLYAGAGVVASAIIA